jgi:hypothetical protein
MLAKENFNTKSSKKLKTEDNGPAALRLSYKGKKLRKRYNFFAP